jgi:anhydro-N-acetylmuramic acid kinase
MPAEALYVGLLSGTSLDGIDAILVDFGRENPRVVTQLHTPYEPSLRAQLRELTLPGDNEIDRLGQLDIRVAEAFAEATRKLLAQDEIKAEAVNAIGSHGQTLRHRPDSPYPFTLQIGDPSTIAQRTGITTVADFRRRDMAAGGQGAPLVPAFHAAVFRHNHYNRVILNLGGIANITWLPADTHREVLGFDTGPGNTLLDQWHNKHKRGDFDRDGNWAASGKLEEALLRRLLGDPYFQKPPPKSTGTEYFNLPWLQALFREQKFKPENIQASLAEFTARSVADAIFTHCRGAEQLFVCGGGVHNRYLLRRLENNLPGIEILPTSNLGIDPDWVEAVTFAWLAKQTLEGLPGNLPTVTGASHPVILGGIYRSASSHKSHMTH